MTTRCFSVTVLSNFARGFDKYARTYSKVGITESTFPDRFFLLRRDELSVGVEKATRLLEKLALTGNRLVVLETRFAEDSLRQNLWTGLGRWVDSPAIRLDGLHNLIREGDCWRLEPLAVEEATALSLRLIPTITRCWPKPSPRLKSVQVQP